MSYYNAKTFVDEISKYNELFKNGADPQKICDIISSYQSKIKRKCSWLKFDSEIKKVISDYFEGVGVTVNYPKIPVNTQELYKLPDIDTVHGEAEIIKYLTITKNRSIESNLKNLFLFSQNEKDEKFNYFAAIFYALLKTDSKKDKISFICLYVQTILTQNISRSMLCFLIAKYAKLCTKSLDDSLGVLLNSGDINFEKRKNRTMFLKIAYALRFIDTRSHWKRKLFIRIADSTKFKDRIFTHVRKSKKPFQRKFTDDKENVIKRSRNLIKNCFSVDDYNPRSFLEMIYYYSVYHGIPLEENKKMMRVTMSFIIKMIFEKTSYKEIEEYVKKQPEDSVTSFLDFNRSSISSISDFIEEKNSSDNSFDVNKTVNDFLKKKNVFKDSKTFRYESTYDFFVYNVIPIIKSCSESQQFCEWMVKQNRFYEGYYYSGSFTRANFFGLDDKNDGRNEEKIAKKIVYDNIFNVTGVVDFTPLRINGWKEDVLAQKTYALRLKRVAEYINIRLDQIDSYNGTSEKIEKIRWFSACDRELLNKVILNELIQEEHCNSNTNRSDILFNAFRICAESGQGVEEFIDIIDNAEMDMLRFAWFDPSRFEDALLYLCLESDDPLEMFEKITSISGFEYK